MSNESNESNETETVVESTEAVVAAPAGEAQVTEKESQELDAVYIQFVRRVMEAASPMGIRLEEKKGWVNLSGTNGHRIDIQKSQLKLPQIYSTLEPELCGGSGLSKPNGRIRSRLVSDPEAIVAALPLLNDSENPIAAPKRGKGGSKGKEIPSLDSLLAKSVAAPAIVVEETVATES